MVDLSRKDIAELRQRAEARMGSVSVTWAKAPSDIQSLVRERQLHQIELDMPHEALQRAQEKVEESRDRSIDLHESAPVGYFTLLNIEVGGMLHGDHHPVAR